MADMVEDIVHQMERVNLTQSIYTKAFIEKDRSDRAELEGKIQELVRITDETAAQARQVEALNVDNDILLTGRVNALTPLIQKSAEIADACHALQGATAEYIIARFSSFADGRHNTHALLAHFHLNLKAIISNILETTQLDEFVLIRILEECHRQSYSMDGTLRSEDYLDSVYEKGFASPYDPDFESEAYYDHEARLEIDEDYAASESTRRRQKLEERDENERNTERAWVGFWTRSLSGCLNGPTLFWPFSARGYGDLPATPRYLFRTFDAASSGNSDTLWVASPASIHGHHKVSKEDLLLLEREQACQKLCAHLNKNCFGEGDHTDNLMSWSSSLLFVVQYAIWRCIKGGRQMADVKICAVDTKRFPCGQFARDTWLIKKCCDGKYDDPALRNIIRLRETGYDNGEYLSQGKLRHQGRSCVVSLQKLIDSGLYELYPELADPNGGQQWTNRVRHLRTMWADPVSTTKKEIQAAYSIAASCFSEVGSFELALFILTFRNRDAQAGCGKGLDHSKTQQL